MAAKSKLLSYELPSFRDGYNSYSASKLLIKDTEIPQGAMEVTIDDNGSATKRNGKSQYSAQVASGHALYGLGKLKTSSLNVIVTVSNTSWYKIASGSSTALTGVSFTADKATDFEQAFSKLYGANNTDALAYTSDGATLTSISSNGNIGRWPVFYSQSLYMTNATNADRIYYSNPYVLDLTANPPTLTGFDDAHMFDTVLSDTPKKTAGYIVLQPGGGVEITRLYKDNISGTDYLFAATKSHGLWRIVRSSTANSDGSIVHTVVQINNGSGIPAGTSVTKANNDTWLYDGFNFSTYGEVATFTNPRITPKGGRVKSEAVSIANAGRALVASAFYNSKLYFSYMTGTYNDRVIVFDTILNAWSSPYTNWNVSRFLVHEESDGTRRLLGASSYSSDSYVYELDTGTNDVSTPISASFQTKSTDCGQPGLIKRFAFIDVTVGSNFGTLTYSVLVDEVTNLTGSVQTGTSASNPVGVGTVLIGTFLVGKEYNSSTTFATAQQNYSFRIDCSYAAGKRIAVSFSNANSSEQFKINGIKIWYQPGSIFEQ